MNQRKWVEWRHSEPEEMVRMQTGAKLSVCACKSGRLDESYEPC